MVMQETTPRSVRATNKQNCREYREAFALTAATQISFRMSDLREK